MYGKVFCYHLKPVLWPVLGKLLSKGNSYSYSSKKITMLVTEFLIDKKSVVTKES